LLPAPSSPFDALRAHQAKLKGGREALAPLPASVTFDRRCSVKQIAVVLVASLTLVAWTGLASAQTPQKPLEFKVTVTAEPVVGSAADHFLTFSGPVEIPDVGLAPGTYIFRILAPSVVQVLSKDRKMVYTTFFTIPTWRPDSEEGDVVAFVKTRNDAPLRMIKWFEPNQLQGRELLYPPAGEEIVR
jgi:hypothetical protein